MALYTQPRAFLQRPAAESLLRAHRALLRQGYGLLIHDAYRPWWVTKVFWEATPPAQRDFVADPTQGSRHNRGCAVDLTLYEVRTGDAVRMPGLYDEMSERSSPEYPGGTSRQRALRDLLRVAMETAGFEVHESEWWHFDLCGLAPIPDHERALREPARPIGRDGFGERLAHPCQQLVEPLDSEDTGHRCARWLRRVGTQRLVQPANSASRAAQSTAALSSTNSVDAGSML